MFPFQPKPKSCPTFEETFFKHYARLSEWALQLTGSNRSEAEDLVQELYIRFAHVGMVSERIEDAEDYIFSVLRNLHYARARSARISAIDDLSILDFDSAERGLRAVDRNAILFVRADLDRICEYLCERKNTSRAASILILRYFLGYFPGEVMKVVQATRVAIDKAVQAARREARLDLERPGVLRQIGTGQKSKARRSSITDDSQSLFLALRAKVFNSCTGECFGRPLLEAKYAQLNRSFTTEELAHLVSCPICLDHANRILGLPLLDDRSPDETIGRDTPQGPDGPGQTPILVPSRPKPKKEDSEQRRRRLKRCVEEANQHRPQRLQIVVDGHIRASQKVTAELSELQVELASREKPAFIEVLSEQGVCLAFVLVQVPTPDGGLYQSQDVELSDGRTMKVDVSFTAEAPAIRVVYRDPLMAPDAQAEQDSEIVLENAQDATLAVVSPVTPSVETLPAFTYSEVAHARDLSGQLWRWLTRFPHPKMNPLFASAVLFGLCSIVCFLLWTRSGPHISARTLLVRAEQSDASVLKPGQSGSVNSGVIYQKVRISAPSHSLERAIYRDPERKRRPKQQHLNAADQRLKDRLDLAGVTWDEPLSAANYSEWHDSQTVKQDVVTQSGANLLTLTTTAATNSEVVQESLTVRESDFHPVARTIRLRDEETVEIAELNYDVMPWGAVNQDWFEPLAGQTVMDVPGIHTALHIPHVLSDLELDEAELSARIVLNQLHADTGEQIHLTRGATGIDVKGVVDTDSRKQEIVSHLVLLPNVHSSILSTEEIGSRPQSRSTFGNSQPVQAYSVEAQASPLEQYLREKKLPLDQLSAISQSLLDQSLRIQQAEVHLSELQQRFKEANQLPADQQSQLTELSRNYINAIQAGLDANKHTLFSIGLDWPAQTTSSSDSSADGEEIDRQVRRYQELCQQLITSGTGEPISAAVIAGELNNSGSLIRSGTAQIYASVSTAHN